MEQDERYDWLALRAVPGIGDVLYKRLIERFGPPRAVTAATQKELMTVEGVGPQTAEAIKTFRPNDRGIQQELGRVDKLGIGLVSMLDERYPVQLKAIYDPPPILYMKGSLEPQDRQAVAIVGARRATEYGRWITEQIVRGLVAKGFTIVSGMARGIDGYAHRAAVSAKGRTVAVLGCGVDVIYPEEHRTLRNEIVARGCLLSEFSMGTGPHPNHFPQRNRIISGLSLGTLVVEAGLESGALITARYALDQNREVFAVPGNLGTKTSLGTNRLIKQGARLVETAEDIVEELSPQLVSALKPSPSQADRTDMDQPPADLSKEESVLLKSLSHEPKHIDLITQETRLSSSQTSGMLLQLELKGHVRQLAGQLFVLNQEGRCPSR
jgi:DNA processing protein